MVNNSDWLTCKECHAGLLSGKNAGSPSIRSVICPSMPNLGPLSVKIFVVHFVHIFRDRFSPPAYS